MLPPGQTTTDTNVDNAESNPVADGIEATRVDVQPVRSILKVGKQNEGQTNLKQQSGNGNISWQDFHGQDLTRVHEYEPR